MELSRMRPSQHRTAWRRRQRGFTLTEVLISIALLALVGASLAGAFGVGLRVLGPGGAQASLQTNNDVLAFEQQIGADVARASCLAAGSTLLPSGGCSTFETTVGGSPSKRCPVAYQFCVGWYAPGNTCHAIVYASKSNGSSSWIERRDLGTSSGARISTTGLTMSVNLNSSQTSSNATTYSWTTNVVITITQQLPRQVPPSRTTVFHAVPRSADPLSSAPGVPPPC